MSLPPSNERCLFFGHIFKMDEVKRKRVCARCGILEIDHAIEYLSSLQHTVGQQPILSWKSSHDSQLWTPEQREQPPPRKIPVASRIIKTEDNVITVRFGGKV